MSKDPENFDPLLKLLALKQYEQPPPGYFDQLSQEISARVNAGASDRTVLMQAVDGELGWLARIRTFLEAKPILVGACGMAVLAVMLSSLFRSPAGDPASEDLLAGGGLTSTPAPLWGPYQAVSLSTNSDAGPPIDGQAAGRLFGDFSLRGQPLRAGFPSGGK